MNDDRSFIWAVLAPLIAGVVLLAYACTAPAWGQSAEVRLMQEQMIFPTVRVVTARGTGSGVVIHSAERDGAVETYVITNNHVVQSAEFIARELDGEQYRERVRVGAVEVEWQDYHDGRVSFGTVRKKARVVRRNPAADLALLRLADDVNVAPYVATLAPAGSHVYMGEEVYAVGSGLGLLTQMTRGFVGLADHFVNDRQMLVMNSASIINGNSGGGLFRRTADGFELVGLPTMVAARGGMPITHIALAVSAESIRDLVGRGRTLCHVLDQCPEAE